MKNFKFDTLCYILGGILAMVLTLLFYVFFISIMGFIMGIFGFNYENMFSLLAFFLGIEFCSFPFELLAHKFTTAQEKLGNMTKRTGLFMLSAFCVLINVSFLWVFSVLLSGITASSLAVMVASFCLLPFSLMRTMVE